MDFFHSIILGVTQGITEFLPISSSGHLVLIPYLFNWNYQGLNFDIALHMGTVIAIVAYFWRDWINIIANTIGRESGVGSREKNIESALRPTPYALQVFPKNFLWQILIASIPAAVVGFLIKDYVESTLHSPLLLAINLAVFGFILWIVDKYSKSSYKLQVTSYKQTFFVGLMQSLALIPGVSRSGITMVASRSLGLDRESAARFSFLLGTPAMVGAFLLDLKDLSLNDVSATFILGVFFSTVFGLLAIKYLIQYLKRGNFSVFAWYRIILAAIVLAVYFSR